MPPKAVEPTPESPVATLADAPRRDAARGRPVEPPGFVASAGRVLDLTLGEMLWSRRTIFMALIVGGPVVIAVLLRALVAFDLVTLTGAAGVTGAAVFGGMVWLFYLLFIVPVLAVFYGTSLIADEVEDKTLTYLFTRPVPRGAVLFGKYLGYLVCTNLVVLPSLVIVYFLTIPLLGGSVGSSFPSLVTDIGLLSLGLAVYGAIFALVGAWFRHPLLTGLVFVFVWEPGAVVVPGYMKHLTVAYYLHGLVPHAMPAGTLSLLEDVLQFFQVQSSTWVNLTSLLVIWVVAMVGAIRAVEHREYVLEQ